MKITFKLIGGPHDGGIVVGHTSEQLTDRPLAEYLEAHLGIGHDPVTIPPQFVGFTSAGARLLRENQITVGHGGKAHRYRITDRRDADDEIQIRAEYVGIVR